MHAPIFHPAIHARACYGSQQDARPMNNTTLLQKTLIDLFVINQNRAPILFADRGSHTAKIIWTRSELQNLWICCPGRMLFLGMLLSLFKIWAALFCADNFLISNTSVGWGCLRMAFLANLRQEAQNAQSIFVKQNRQWSMMTCLSWFMLQLQKGQKQEHWCQFNENEGTNFDFWKNSSGPSSTLGIVWIFSLCVFCVMDQRISLSTLSGGNGK